MAYRSDLDAMEARVANLDSEVLERTRERDDARRLLVEARAKARHEAVLEDLVAGGPTRRLRRNALIGIGAIATCAVAVLGYRAMHRDDWREEIIAQLDHFSQEMCACKDQACSHEVNDDFTKWASQMAKDDRGQRKPDEDLMRRATTSVETYSKCMMKLMSSESQ